MINNKVIHCRCNPKTDCLTYSSNGSYCATNEGCFKSIHFDEVNGKRGLTMGCFKNRSQHYLMHCQVRSLINFEIKCCRDRDFCNERLYLPSDKLLNVTQPIYFNPVDQYVSDNGLRLIIAIVLPICLVVMLACLFTMLWKSLWNHKRKLHIKLEHQSKYYPDSSLLAIKTPLFLYPCDSNILNSSGHRNNSNWPVETFTGSGLPGSKNSSGIGVKSNGTATTVISATDSGHGVTLEKLRDDTCTSGSGSGLPFLVQRTVARQINLVECIGKGKFGEVWKGQFQGESVAVKIFSSREESSWTRETKIYNTILLRHDNILGYYASDLISNSGCTQLWMVMQYHPLGSLHEYLVANTISPMVVLKLAHSAAAGLCHLHTSIMGLQGKPAIAHRDVKSKNILVKRNLTCCIADLGLAVFPESSGNNEILGDTYNNRIVGTKRYMAPELLELACFLFNKQSDNSNSTNVYMKDSNASFIMNIHGENYMESLKAADVYSFSLVLWEIMSRVVINGNSQPYQLPFSESVPSDPSFEEMFKVVVESQLRPTISDEIQKHLNPVYKIMEECWHERPCIRLTMLRVKKSLFHIMQKLTSLPEDHSDHSDPSKVDLRLPIVANHSNSSQSCNSQS